MKTTFRNPNGIESFSPGLRGTSYPGLTDQDAPTPTGLRHTGRAEGCNPFRVDDVWFTISQGSSFLATLGWMMESRWDSRTGARQARDLEQTIAGFSLSLWERVGVRVRLLPNMAEIIEA